MYISLDFLLEILCNKSLSNLYIILMIYCCIVNTVYLLFCLSFKMHNVMHLVLSFSIILCIIICLLDRLELISLELYLNIHSYLQYSL